MTDTLTAEDLTFDDGEHKPYPFEEDEWGNITGYGHQDRATFAAEITRYDAELDGAVDAVDWTTDINHTYVCLDEDGEHLHECAATDSEGFPVTTLWGAR